MRTASRLARMVFAFPAMLAAQEKVNADSQVLADFGKRVADYVKLHHIVSAQMPGLKSTNSPDAIQHHEHELAEHIRVIRRNVQQGSIFTQPIVAEFRRLLNITLSGSDATHIRQSLQHAEPLRSRLLRINGSYPAGLPLQSIPPSLLLNLPPLPPEVEYRIVGHDLILRDVGANLIVDFIPGVIP